MHDRPGALPVGPRAGKKNIDVMMHDFLTAWLVDGDTLAAFGYFSKRSYACMTEDRDDGSAIDRGIGTIRVDCAEGSARGPGTTHLAGRLDGRRSPGDARAQAGHAAVSLPLRHLFHTG